MLIKNPNLPLFVLREVNEDPAKLISKVGFNTSDSGLYIVRQWQEFVAVNKGPLINPIHIMVNIIGMTIFPFLASPMLRNRTGMSMEDFNKLMEERKVLIPVWVNAIITTSIVDQE